MTSTPYLLDNAWREGRARLDAVEEFLDPGSIHVLTRVGVSEGWRCLEVGAGGGSIANWLATRVGEAGKVVATDIDTRHLNNGATARNIEVRAHNMVNDDLETQAYDLVHARLVLEHIPEREAVLRKLVQALKPGGWLVVEAVDYVSAIPVSDKGAAEHARSQAIRLHAFTAAGARTDYGRHLPAAMRSEGLVDIANEGRVFVMEGGSPGARWFKLSMMQLRQRLVGPDKLTDVEIEHMLELFDAPDWTALSPIIFACYGRASRG